MQGEAGIGQSTLIVLLTISVSLVAVLSAVGIIERANLDRTDGGIYRLLCHVLGARLAAAVAIIYCFGQVRWTLITRFRFFLLRCRADRGPNVGLKPFVLLLSQSAIILFLEL